MAEKGVTDVVLVTVNIAKNEHQQPAYRAKSPHAKVPALELDDGRVLTETRAICSYLEGRFPEPNLMGVDFEERAFIEMADRQIEFYLLGGFANCIRHTHPGLAPLEQPQFPDFGRSQGEKVRAVARWLDGVLAQQPYISGARFTVADITAFVALEFARGLMKFSAGALTHSVRFEKVQRPMLTMTIPNAKARSTEFFRIIPAAVEVNVFATCR